MPRPNAPLATLFAFVLLAAALAGGAWLVWMSQPQATAITIMPPQASATPAPTATPSDITVYVTGAVAQPATLVTLPYASRVQDALAAVGGLSADADPQQVNLAGLLRDGDQVHVPSRATPMAELPTPSGGGIIAINTATAAEIASLPGIGDKTAAAIVAYREQNGYFSTLDDLDAVEGIGAKTLEAIAANVSFDVP